MQTDHKGRDLQTRQLPPIDRVELFLLTSDPNVEANEDFHTGYFMGVTDQRTVSGKRAEEFAAIWRAQEYENEVYDLVPHYAVRMYEGDKLILESTVHFLFKTVRLKNAKGSYVPVEFHDQDGALIQWFDRELPLPPPDRARVEIRLAQDALQNADYQRFKAHVDNADRLSPNQFETAFLNAYLVYLTKSPDDAIEAFGRVIEEHDEHFEPAFYRAIVYSNLNEHLQALDDFNIAAHHLDQRTFFVSKDCFFDYRGRALLALGEFAQAVEDFSTAIETARSGGRGVPAEYYERRAQAFHGLGFAAQQVENEVAAKTGHRSPSIENESHGPTLGPARIPGIIRQSANMP